MPRPRMSVLAPGVAWVDLQFRGSPHVIATAVLSGSGGAALVDPGPASCLDSLELGLNGMGIRFEDVTHILLTHVHLCLLYTSDAADERSSVDLGGRRIIKK